MYLLEKIIFIFIIPQVKLQQIFENTYPTCVLLNEQDNQPITVLNKHWEVIGFKVHRDSVIRFSICNPSTGIQDCDIGSTVCVINKQRPSYNIKNAGTSFIYTKDDDGSNILRSINGQSCDEHENFTTIIEFSNNPDVSIQPKFKFMGECELKIEMKDPSFQPPCTSNKAGNFIDMRPLKYVHLEVEHPETKRKFSLNLCKKSVKCDTDVSVCELTEDGRSAAISNVMSQRVVSKDGVYSIQGHTLEPRKKRRNFILTLKCNWKVNGIDKLVYVPQKQQGKTFFFSAESSLACIKLPIDCIVRDTFQKNFLYDLTSLNRPNAWTVRNVSNGRIRLNMCGPLKFTDSTNECAKQHSQVCLSNPGVFNLGSIQKSIEVNHQDNVVTSFTDGSVCVENATKSYTTEIEFICKSVEDGPVLHSKDECVYRIKWYTPTACPMNAPIGEDCIISDLSGPVQLKKMYQEKDVTHILSQHSHLRYNLCGPLRTPCNNDTNAGVCLVKNNKETVLGRSSSTLVMNGNVIMTIMKGSTCSGKTSEIVINYHCNHMKSASGEVQVNILRDFCDYEFNIATSTACPPASTYSCKWYNGNLLYDLSSLILNDKNYEVKHGDYLYSFNLCRSVIKTSNAQCSAFTAICMKNLTELHAKRMYTSLGMANTVITPIVEGGDLILEYKDGQLCHHDYSYISSRIRFKCSQNNELPKLINKTSCNYEFIWRTRSACSTRVSSHKTRALSSCSFRHPTTKEIVDLTKINADIHIEGSNEGFNISLCGSNFTHCPARNSSNCSMIDGSVEMQSTSYGLYLIYKLFNKSCSSGAINTVNISLNCEPGLTDIDLKVTSIKNCTVYANLKTSYICNYVNETQIILLEEKPIVIESDHSLATNLRTQPEIDRLSAKQPCIIPEFDNFNLDNLKNIKVSSLTNNSYTFNFDLKDSDCDGLICKNNLSLISKKHDCPFIQINNGDSTIRLIYISTLECLDTPFRAEIFLRCDSESSVPVISKESDCTVVVFYPLQQVCSLFPHTGYLEVSSADAVGVAVGSAIGVIIFLLAVFGGITAFKKKNILKKASYATITGDKESLQLYSKNAQD